MQIGNQLSTTEIVGEIVFRVTNFHQVLTTQAAEFKQVALSRSEDNRKFHDSLHKHLIPNNIFLRVSKFFRYPKASETPTLTGKLQNLIKESFEAVLEMKFREDIFQCPVELPLNEYLLSLTFPPVLPKEKLILIQLLMLFLENILLEPSLSFDGESEERISRRCNWNSRITLFELACNDHYPEIYFQIRRFRKFQKSESF